MMKNIDRFDYIYIVQLMGPKSITGLIVQFAGKNAYSNRTSLRASFCQCRERERESLGGNYIFFSCLITR